MKKKKIIISIIVIIAVIVFLFIGYLLNSLLGNPINKKITQAKYLSYFENTYNEKFIVYKSEYNPKIPAYIFTVGPEKNKDIRFDTALYGMKISDEYGGLLASLKLSENISQMLNTKYGYLNLKVIAKEDPLTGYGNEMPDYFETDPDKRVLKNHYIVDIFWADEKINETEFRKISSGIINLIENKLPYKTPNLVLNISVKPDINSTENIFYETAFLFQTTN